MMPQLSLYIEKEIFAEIEDRAKQEKLSLSKWVGQCIGKFLKDEYPPAFLRLRGSLKNIPFEVPPQGSFADDVPREFDVLS